jgi:Flp pilus assembly protein TadB
VIRTAVAWLLAWPVAMLLRGIFVDHGIPPLSFALVVLLFNMLLLLIWRWPFALNNRMRKRGS